jgi:hypothetical protein
MSWPIKGHGGHLGYWIALKSYNISSKYCDLPVEVLGKKYKKRLSVNQGTGLPSWISNCSKKIHFIKLRETFVGSLVTRWPWAQDLNKKSNMLKFVTYAWTDGYQILFHQKCSFWASSSGEVQTQINTKCLLI